jgi:hypothetical protein
VADSTWLTYVREMSPLKKFLLPVAVAVLAAALLAPSMASAQRGCRPAGSPKCERADQFGDKREALKERLEQRRDAARGITPACRAAHEKWEDGVEARTKANTGVKTAKAKLKNAKTKKAKAKRAKALKRAKAKLKKAKKTEATLLAARGTGCQGSAQPS